MHPNPVSDAGDGMRARIRSADASHPAASDAAVPAEASGPSRNLILRGIRNAVLPSVLIWGGALYWCLG